VICYGRELSGEWERTYRKNAGSETLPGSSVKLSIPSMAELESPHPRKK
jgi:hypothetical protein